MANSVGFLLQLPQEFFSSASTLAGAGTAERTELADATTEDAEVLNVLPQQQPSETQHVEAAATCLTCGIGVSTSGFTEQSEQRAHFRSDWHRFNVKRKLASRSIATEAEFEQIVSEQGEVSSISGSDTESDDEEASTRHAVQKSAQLLFRGSDGRAFGVWRPLLLSEQDSRTTTDTELLQRLVQLNQTAKCWVILLSKGGHFAAAVFDLRPMQHAQHSKADGPGFKELAHKSFHRYVVRAKAGGRQSAQDATGKFAKSAGSQIRRYNEAALDKEIRETLASWQGLLSQADRIFVQASVSNARPIFAGDSPALSRTDPRVRSIPIATRRPTFSETKRVLRMLLTVFEPSEQALQALTGPHPSQQKAPKQQPQKPATAVVAEPEPQQPMEPEPPLHEAAKSGNADRVKSLLEGGADPTRQDPRGRVAYDVAADKPVRDAFRRFMAEEPDRWDYAAAGVPSPLTSELESQQLAKQADKKARQREKEKERKKAAAEKKAKAAEGARAAAEAEVATAATEAAALAARSKQGKAGKPPPASKSEQEAAKRREQMAAAAEARMARLQLSSQQQQLWS